MQKDGTLINCSIIQIHEKCATGSVSLPRGQIIDSVNLKYTNFTKAPQDATYRLNDFVKVLNGNDGKVCDPSAFRFEIIGYRVNHLIYKANDDYFNNQLTRYFSITKVDNQDMLYLSPNNRLKVGLT